MYKVLTIVATDAEVILEEYDDFEKANTRLQEQNETNENCLEMQSFVFILDGDLIKHNIKTITKF